ncbi:hypothetical protein BaRGS_00008334 [Batillaria attramentaria]|uniref:C2 domain-containing protein n=1 Tax=Batillaria attramentaria TaxID=370345 RepID=A0ABD0LN09_9CAEN
MPGRLKVRLLAARDLPVMDRASDLTDAFVEVRFAGEMFKTEVCKKSLNPQWNSEWFKFEVDDEVLQDEPLDIRVLDYDTYSAHDAIGKVYIDLNPLLTRDLPYVISGWFPIYDTMHGIRGELNVQVKVELFSDFNKFRQSSCGIQFFCTASVPSGYRLQGVQGFVEELVVNDDPEYQWIDKIRTPRASNEARQRLFSKLTGGLQRKVGVKVLEMGGNAVLGYTQNFDLEGESGIVVRAIGTAVTIGRLPAIPPSPLGQSPLKDPGFVFGSFEDKGHLGGAIVGHDRGHHEGQGHRQSQELEHEVYDPDAIFSSSSPLPEDSVSSGSPPLPSNRHSVSPVRTTGAVATNRDRRLSDSDVGSPPGGNSLAGSRSSGINMSSAPRAVLSRATINQQNIALLEYPFFTMRSFPPGFIVSLGSMVSARSVKLLDKIHNPGEWRVHIENVFYQIHFSESALRNQRQRDMWWGEIRTEIRSHARSMNCHAVLGYIEQTTICGDIIILSASGTAARISFDLEQGSQGTQLLQPTVLAPGPTVSGDQQHSSEREKDKEKRLTVDIGLANQLAQIRLAGNIEGPEELADNCALCHIPYRTSTLPFPVNLSPCAFCKKKKVPDILFTTIDPPKEIPILSHGSLIQARVIRSKSKGKGSETAAREVSDSLPFLEYELHSQLLNKLKMRGLNALFGLKIQICLGETMIAALATGTGVFLGAMPQPPVPKLSTQVQVATAEETRDLAELQARITDVVQQHRDRLNTEIAEETGLDHSPHGAHTDDSDEEQSDLEVSFLGKDTFILEVDDPKDEIISLILKDCRPPAGFEVCNTQFPPGVSTDRLLGHAQMFTQMAEVRYLPQINTKVEFADIFDMLLRRMCFKLRRLAPCCLTDLNFTMEIPDEDEVQVAVTGCCLSLGESQSQNATLLSVPSASSSARQSPRPTGQQDEMMFNMEVDTDSKEPSTAGPQAGQAQPPSFTLGASPVATNPKPHVGVELTPLPTVIGGKIIKYLGNYNFFLIRESTSVKECGGLGGFMQSFIGEVMAIVRGHVAALGGNALVGYQMNHCVLFSSLHKNQAQCLINVCGDAVQISYDNEPVCVELPTVPDTS